jgi:D-glycero-alpha-D-manno-heptose-7-phosphate kinase
VVQPIIMKPERRDELQSMMLFLPGSRALPGISRKTRSTISVRAPTSCPQSGPRSITPPRFLADEGGSIGDLGHLLHESWQLKRELAANVSNRQIDEIYDAGRAAGALGGKLLGAGGGGFMVFLVDPSKRESIRGRLKNLIHVSIGIDSEGSRIVLYQPNGI